MSDLISRQDAIEAVRKKLQDWGGYAFEDYRRGLYEAQDILEALPSAEAVHGEWVNRSMNIRYPEWERYTCSVCGKHSYLYDFCPNCGAKMEGEDGEE